MRLWRKLNAAFDWLLLALGFANPKLFLTASAPRRRRKVYDVPLGGGAREVARRRRQIERGILKCSPTP
ncbi:hypothetical protein NH8B_0559 [Pseudogulbenkiania sp. NH8B]|uniref:hypothetical protein n=1 Tax=Pseudogulbenkiania sp. (strain NH8B) TaxID=748280 RepID=UPI0002279502|nr:hypothetical protein [Pseudogulbenkiania sp. NH8B]BAK75394.1 hypothetical protein NH8B_0559 [Pseudogulbenkiania sp. NH8B]